MTDPFNAAMEVRFDPPDLGTMQLVAVAADLSAGLDLPGLTAHADHFGASIALELMLDRTGDLLGGFVALRGPTPTPPTSISLALGAPMPGGGRIERVNANTYRGAIGLDLGVVVVAGFASIQLADPISIAAVLSGTFRPPIQLSFGFTLVGIGGVIGINRRMDREGLSAALTSGELGNMLFPRDPVGDADAILPALDRCFPVSRGDFFVGPMLKLGWGTPTIVSATLAIIVGTNGVAIIGNLRLSLPCEDAPFAVFNVIVLGFIDDHGVSIDGSLVNSRIGPITIDGDARFRLTSGANGTMALSVGGFHPQYTPPPGMAGMRRLSAEMSPLPFASMRLEGYTALTTDSVQLGGGVHIRADLEVAAIEGQATFDAIVFFSPFHFRADFHASLSLEVLGEHVAGVSVTAHFSGPGHWDLNGSLSIEILWWDVDVHIAISWGDELPAPLATDNPVALVAAQLNKRENWSVHPGASAQRMVVMGDGIPGAPVPLSPIGPLDVTQTAAPLAQKITRIGGLRLPEPMTITIESGAAMTPITRGFPRGLFFDLDEQAVATGSPLAVHQAGATIGDNAPLQAPHSTKVLDFEDCILDPHGETVVSFAKGAALIVDLLQPLIAAGAAARRRDIVEMAVSPPRFTFIGAPNG